MIDLELWKSAGYVTREAPMSRDFPAIKQARRSEPVDSGADRSDPSGSIGPRQNPLRHHRGNLWVAESASAGNDNGVEFRRCPESIGGAERHAGFGKKRALFQSNQTNVVARYSSAKSIFEGGGCEGVGRAGQMHGGKAVEPKDTNPFRSHNLTRDRALDLDSRVGQRTDSLRHGALGACGQQ